MPVTIRPTAHAPRKWQGSPAAKSPNDLFSKACPAEHRLCKNSIQSSFTIEDSISPSTNGFVRAAVAAYSCHHHLTIRPEDVWFAILTQLGFFINANAEEVRSFFVSHQGRKELEVIELGNIHTVDFGLMARRMTELIAKNVVDPELRTWIMPAFSTTTESDKVVASVLMMGAMQQYFSYKFSLACGIPTVTLLGVRSDWEQMLNRLEMLPRLGSEPAQFCALLKPVLRFFVKSFDSPTDATVLDFWSKIAHESGGSGPYYLSGWITAFCFWKPDGKLLYAPPKGRIEIEGFGHRNPGCELDGTLYHRVDTDDIPDGHAAVPVTVDDNGHIYKTRMVAGSVGIRVTSSDDILDIGRGLNNRRVSTLGENNSTIPDVMEVGIRVTSSGEILEINKDRNNRYAMSSGDTLDLGRNGNNRCVFTPGANNSRIPYVMERQPEQDTWGDSLQPVSGWWMYEVLEGVEGITCEGKKVFRDVEDDSSECEDLKSVYADILVA